MTHEENNLKNSFFANYSADFQTRFFIFKYYFTKLSVLLSPSKYFIVWIQIILEFWQNLGPSRNRNDLPIIKFYTYHISLRKQIGSLPLLFFFSAILNNNVLPCKAWHMNAPHSRILRWRKDLMDQIHSFPSMFFFKQERYLREFF